MKFVEPEVFVIAQTELDYAEFNKWLSALGAEGWGTNAISDAEMLIEAAGKSCYNAFRVDMNANLKRVRENHNKEYIQNILKSKHGSVLEHANVTIACLNVSRVFTHELVRHRIAGFSQQSLRFIRLTDLKAWFPIAFRQAHLDKLQDALDRLSEDRGESYYALPTEEWLRGTFMEIIEFLEHKQRVLADALHLDKLEGFAEKKILTSAMRRLAPIGLATGIMMTANLRTWRHVIELRTSPHAEEEIRLVFGQIFNSLSTLYPSAFQDASSLVHNDGTIVVGFEHSKV